MKFKLTSNHQILKYFRSFKIVFTKYLIKNYELNDVYNIDETGLFWKLLQDKTNVGKILKPKGMKKAKDGLTILFRANMSAKKLEPLIIGKCKNPRGLNHEKVKNAILNKVIDCLFSDNAIKPDVNKLETTK